MDGDLASFKGLRNVRQWAFVWPSRPHRRTDNLANLRHWATNSFDFPLVKTLNKIDVASFAEERLKDSYCFLLEVRLMTPSAQPAEDFRYVRHWSINSLLSVSHFLSRQFFCAGLSKPLWHSKEQGCIKADVSMPFINYSCVANYLDLQGYWHLQA